MMRTQNYIIVNQDIMYLNGGRFIGSDSIEYLDPNSINGMNQYAYCGNDPVNKIDPTGHFAISTFLIGLMI